MLRESDNLLQDGVAMLWDLAEGKRLYSLDAGDIIHALTFSPNRYWLCTATQVRRRRVADRASFAVLLDCNNGEYACAMHGEGRFRLVAVELQSCIKIWDLESKSIVDELRPEFAVMSKKATVSAT